MSLVQHVKRMGSWIPDLLCYEAIKAALKNLEVPNCTWRSVEVTVENLDSLGIRLEGGF
jgi:hypothetical protein